MPYSLDAGETIHMTNWSCHQAAPDSPMRLVAFLLVKTPTRTPAEMSVRVEFDYPDMPGTTAAQIEAFVAVRLRVRFGHKNFRQVQAPNPSDTTSR